MHLSNALITNTYAANASTQLTSNLSAATNNNGNVFFIVMLVVLFAFIYLTLWRPQNKRLREQQALLSSLTKDDEVLTSSGMMGKINQVNDQYLLLALADHTSVIMQKTAVLTLLPKGTVTALRDTLAKT